MNKFWKGVLINIAAIYGITLIIALASGFYVFVIAPMVISLLELVVGALFLISEKTTKIAQVMFAASGIVLLIGLAVCTGTFTFNR